MQFSHNIVATSSQHDSISENGSLKQSTHLHPAVTPLLHQLKKGILCTFLLFSHSVSDI
ncbi:hypothetical protein GJAV_G00199920 [Gymnothorax javanicus]|nr:hypothetical protein GJAV_G00199920 [Gymnothorax javanicus]